MNILNNRFFQIFMLFAIIIILFGLLSKESFSNVSDCRSADCNEQLDHAVCYTKGYGKCKYLNTPFQCSPRSIYFQNCQGRFLCAEPSINGGTVFFVDKPDDRCCFEVTEPLYGIRLNKAHSIQSVKFPGHYLRHQGYVLKLHSPIPNHSSYHLKLDYLFRLALPPHRKNYRQAVYILPVQAVYKGSCLYSDGNTVRFRSKRCPDNGTFKQNATFYVGPVTNIDRFLCGSLEHCLKICPMDESCFTCDQNGIYFRNCQGDFLTASPYQNKRIATFQKHPDVTCCFKIVKSPHNIEDKQSYAIESITYPGYYLRHTGFILKLDRKNTFSYNNHLKQDFLFNFAKGKNGDPNSFTLMPVQGPFRSSCFYTDKDKIRFKPGFCPTNPEFSNQTTLYSCPPDVVSRYLCGTTKQCSAPLQASCQTKIEKMKTLVRNFDIRKQSKAFRNLLENRTEFSLSINLYVYDNISPTWNHIIHGGNPHGSHRTPGIWVNNGYLHIRATSTGSWNDGANCWRVFPKLKKGNKYHIIVVYTKREISVYFGNSLNRNCSLRGELRGSQNAYIGKSSPFPGAPLIATIDYIPSALTREEVKSCYYQLDKTKELRLPPPVKTSCRTKSGTVRNITTNARCGPSAGNKACPPGLSCSRWGWCGKGGPWKRTENRNYTCRGNPGSP